MPGEVDEEALRERLQEREREEVQQDAGESFEALKETLSGKRGKDLRFPEFRRNVGEPRIKRIEPEAGVVPGAPLTIWGTDLDLVRAVRIGGRTVESMAVVDHHRLHVLAPPDAEDGRIELVTGEPEPFEATWVDDGDDYEQKEA